ncbi:hypothetical protein ACCS93_33820, partial [Rhizobium ruizarguesonis]
DPLAVLAPELVRVLDAFLVPFQVLFPVYECSLPDKARHGVALEDHCFAPYDWLLKTIPLDKNLETCSV